MSWLEPRVSRFAHIALAMAVAGLVAGCFEPLYGQRSVTGGPGVGTRLAGVDVPAYEDNEASFGDLQARIAKTLAFIQSLPAADIEAGADRTIVLRPGTPKETTLVGTSYLLNYTLPHFFFHTTTAYDILRHNGVEVGKKDFVGAF